MAKAKQAGLIFLLVIQIQDMSLKWICPFLSWQARVTMETNYSGTANLMEALTPLIPNNTGRIVTVTSRAGLSSILRSDELRHRWVAGFRLCSGKLHCTALH
jgi:NAD(P)-dependent dehydrogenase (short-subunit alcohol dehydrogenase family)